MDKLKVIIRGCTNISTVKINSKVSGNTELKSELDILIVSVFYLLTEQLSGRGGIIYKLKEQIVLTAFEKSFEKKKKENILYQRY